MSSATTTTATMCAGGWNAVFTIGREYNRFFAAIYIPPKGESIITFRNVRDELRLCFYPPPPTNQSSNDSDDPWAGIAFASADLADVSNEGGELRLVDGDDLDRPVHRTDSRMNAIDYHVVSHATCHLRSDATLSAHIKNGCARELRDPRRRRHFAPNQEPHHPNVAMLPTQRTVEASSPSTRPTRSGCLDQTTRNTITSVGALPLTPPTSLLPTPGSGQDAHLAEAEAASRQNGNRYEGKRLVGPGENLSQPRSCSEEDDDIMDGYITPWNSDEFLADVDSQLLEFQARQGSR